MIGQGIVRKTENFPLEVGRMDEQVVIIEVRAKQLLSYRFPGNIVSIENGLLCLKLKVKDKSVILCHLVAVTSKAV